MEPYPIYSTEVTAVSSYKDSSGVTAVWCCYPNYLTGVTAFWSCYPNYSTEVTVVCSCYPNNSTGVTTVWSYYPNYRLDWGSNNLELLP